MALRKYKPPKPGDQFTYLTVIRTWLGHGNGNKRRLFAFTRCKCGNERIVRVGSLHSGATCSCGCFHREIMSLLRGRKSSSFKHGMYGTPEYKCWTNMIERCTNPKTHDYKNYGARGITACERWRKFENFFADMGLRPSPKHSIDRYPDNDGNYEPGNCRWATRQEQSLNSRSSSQYRISRLAAEIEREWAKGSAVLSASSEAL